MSLADHQRERELSRMAAMADAQLRSAAVRELRSSLVRMVKGEMAMVLEAWRSNQKLALLLNA